MAHYGMLACRTESDTQKLANKLYGNIGEIFRKQWIAIVQWHMSVFSVYRWSAAFLEVTAAQAAALSR